MTSVILNLRLPLKIWQEELCLRAVFNPAERRVIRP